VTDDEEGGSSLAVGDLVGGKYRITRVLGRGGMGIVYEALQLRLDRKVALKMLHRTLLASSSVVERFEREARAAAKLKGPNVADVLDVDVTEHGIPFIVMEYLEGRDLGQELESRIMMPVEETISCVLQACSAMAEAHKAGIVHRDLKPANLFLHTDGDGYVVKVLDFGISKMTEGEQQDMTMTRSTLGTPLYMSPEQIRSTKHVDGRTDVWAMGVILFECLSGSLPFTGENPSAVIAAITADEPLSLQELCPDLPIELCEVVKRALAKSPLQRYQTIDELAQALVPFAAPGTQWATAGPRKRLITTPGVAPPAARSEPIATDAATMASAARKTGQAVAAVSVVDAKQSAEGRSIIPSSAAVSLTMQSGPTERPTASDADQQAQQAASSSLGGLRSVRNSAAESKITAGAWSTEGPSARPKRALAIGAVAAALITVVGIVLFRGGSEPAEKSAAAVAQPPQAERTVSSGALASPVPAAVVSAKAATPPVASAVPPTPSAAPSASTPSASTSPAAKPKSAPKVSPRPVPAPGISKPEQNPMHL
jgi:serine/threonine-protein kinase